MALCLPARRGLGGQFLKERWLLNFVVVVLVFNVAADDKLIDTHGRDEVATCPEQLAFVETMGAFDFLFHPGRAFAFQYLHNV